ncbi:MAG: hypothetical protein IJ985_02805 [Akkermansia sp.]|nr:hypothetical protein [Akkermansia sp.]
MWKYIIIGSVVLFGTAAFIFHKNLEALTAPSGEVAAIQTQYQDAVTKNKNISLDKTIKAYSDMRTEWLNERKGKADSEKADFDTKSQEVEEEISQLSARYDAIEGDFKRLREELDNTLLGVSKSVGLEEESTDPEEVASHVAELMNENIELEKKVAQEEATITALGNQLEDLTKKIADAKLLQQQRQNRISPADLKCTVLKTDPEWNYVILDAGIDKNIVIGSRLAVMRGDKKICELNMTLVEANRSSGDVVYNTLLPGECVKAGDTVVSVQPDKK